MNEVTVNKAELLEKVKENRSKHRQIFEDAQIKYRELVIEELDLMLKDAKKGRKIKRWIGLPEPEDHTDDYDRVVRMLEMSVDENVTLRAVEFDNYVMDQWGWNASFAANTVSYTQAN